MKQARFFALATTLIALVNVAAQDLPTSPEPGSFEIEPPLLPGNLVPEEAAKGPADMAQLARKLGRAKQSAAGAERLFRMGVLAKVEAESRALRVVKLENELAQARVAAAQSDLDAKKAAVGSKEIAPGEIEAARQTLAELRGAAQIAAANQKKAELDAAALNLARQQKLFALGSAGKSAVRKAEERLAQLKNAAP